MPSLTARAIQLYCRAFIKRSPATPEALVAHLRRRMDNPPLPPWRAGSVQKAAFAEGGLHGARLAVAQPKRAILYLHGGGYLAGTTKLYFPLCGRLAAKLEAEVTLPEYRLAPEHPFPAALDDAVAAYELLLAKGWSPKQLVIAGDSAGGGLTLATLLKLRDQGRPMPAGAIALSPYADLTATAPSHAANDATDAMLSPRMLELCGRLYAGSAAPLRDPYVSPRFGDFTGLPPLLFTVDEEECLRDDTYAVLERAKAAGVATTLIARRGLLHVWPMFYPILPEARADVAKLIAFVKSVT